MKLTIILIFVACLEVSASGYSQVTLSEKNAPLQKIFRQIQKQTGYDFLYSAELLQQAGNVSIDVKNASIDKVMDLCLKDKGLSYSIMQQTIVIKPKSAGIENIAEANDIPLPPPDITVRGRVLDEAGNPIQGVSVMIKGTQKGTTTDANGYFILNEVNEKATLVFTSVNTETFEVAVGGRTELSDINLKTRVTENKEIIISTGYQTISKERATGSYSRVSDKTIEKRPYPNLSSALVGQVPGMVADPATGFTIRGRSSLSGAGDRTPLLVVDGFPIEGGFASINPNDVKSVDVLKDAAATSIYGARASNGVIVVTTKGAASGGKLNINFNSFISVGEMIDLDYYMNMANAEQQIDYEDRMYKTFKGTSFLSDPYNTTNGSFRGIRSPYVSLLIELDKGNITKDYFDKEKAKMLKYDYKDDLNEHLLRNYFFTQNNLIISGSSEKNTYKFSVLYDYDLTSFQYNKNSRLMLTFNDSYSFSKNIKYTLNANYTNWNSTSNGISLSHTKDVISPWSRLFDEDGNYTRMSYQNYEPRVKTFEPRLPYSMRYNLLEETTLKDNSNTAQDFRFQNELEFKIMEGLKFRPMLQFEKYNDESISIYDERMYASRNYANLLAKLDTPSQRYISQIPQGGIYRKNGETKRQSVKFRGQLDYSNTLGEKHDIVAVLGGEVISTTTEVGFPEIKFGYNSSGLNYALFDYNVDRFDIFQNTVLENSIAYEGAAIYNYRQQTFRQAYKYNDNNLSAYFSGSYTFDKRYTFSMSARTEASNYVSPEVRDKFSPFYSFGARWNVKNEKFMNNVEFVDRLSIRGTYGVQGNAAGKNSVLAVTVFSSGAASAETGNLPSGVVSGRDNDFLTWEKTFTSNLGTDFSFFKGKLYGSLDLYRRYSKDLLTLVPTSQVVQSTTSLNLNFGELLNKGLEIQLGTSIDISRNLNWNGVLNFDYNYNEVLKYDFINALLFNYLGSNSSFIPGKPTDRLYMIKLAGTTKDGYYIQETRDGQLVVANNANNNFSNINQRTVAGLPVSEDDRIWYQGRTTPPATMGFTNTFTYKGFSLMAVILGKFGHKFVMRDQLINYGLTLNNYSESGLASLQGISTTATENTGNIFPTINNQAFILASSTLRNFYSDVVVADASHIRLNEIYLGYNIPASFLGGSNRFFKSVNVFTQARNLGVIWKANDQGYDPDFPIGSLKPIRIFTFGAKINI